MTPDRTPDRPVPGGVIHSLERAEGGPFAAHATTDAPLKARVIEAPDAYDQARNQVIHSGEVDVFEARQTAYSWHGGQTSPLYSFASTGAVVHSEDHRAGLEGEIQFNIDWVKARPEDDSFFANTSKAVELDALDNLMRTVKALPAKHPSVEEV